MIFDNLRDKAKDFKQELTSQEKTIDRIVTELGSVYGGTIPGSRKSSEYLNSATGWIYACVNSIADDIASIRLKLMKMNNRGEVTEVDSHPVLDLIYRANNVTTYFDLVKMTFQYLELTGEAPWFIGFEKNKPAQIMLLRPDRLQIIPGTDGELVKGYKYQVNDGTGLKEITLEPFEVIPIRYPDPNSPLRGMGPLRAAAATVDLDESSQSWNTSFFNNAAAPNLALETDKVLSQEVKDKLAKKIRENYEGVRNNGKTMVLESGLKAKSLSISQKDMDYIEQQRFSRDKIMGIFRVPKSILGLTEDVNRANAEASEYVFGKRTIKPKLEGFVQQLNEFLLPLFDQTGTLYFDFEDPVPENMEIKVTQAQTGVTAGYMTINEARALFNLDPVEGGDEIRDPVAFNPLMQGNGAPVASAKQKQKNKPGASRKAALTANKNTRFKSHLLATQLKKELESKMTSIVYGILKSKKDRIKKIKAAAEFFSGTPTEQKSQKLAFQEKQLNIADEFEPKFIQKLNKVFEEQKKIILSSIEEGSKKVALDVDEERERYEKHMKSVFMTLMREQADQALKLLGQQKKFKAASGFNKILEQYFARRAFRFAGEVTRTTNQLVKDSLGAGVEAGEGIPKLKDRIGQLFSGMEEYRAERIARSETIRATNFAAEEAWVDSGVVEAKEWVAFRDERTDDECIDMDGKIIPLGDKFFDKGDKMGNLNFDYENIQHPPLHVNCRCTLVPVVFPAGQTASSWRPKMTEAQANAFAKGSQVDGTWFHGTNLRAANNIEQTGFIPSKNLMGPEAVYFAKDPEIAKNYAAAAARLHGDTATKVLKAKLNIKNLKVFENESDYIDQVEREFGENYGQAELTKFNNKWEAVLIRKTGRYLNYLMVRDPKNIVTFE